MKTKTGITFLLIFALLITTLTSSGLAAARRPDVQRPGCNLVVGIIVVAVGAFICYKLYQCAKKLVNPPPPPPQNPPPQDPSTNSAQCVSNTLDESGIGVYALGGTTGNSAFADGQGGYYTQMAAFNVQATTNLYEWTTVCTVTSWISSSVVLTLVCTNGTPICTNLSVGPTGYGTAGNTNCCVLPVSVMPTNFHQRFFRLEAL